MALGAACGASGKTPVSPVTPIDSSATKLCPWNPGILASSPQCVAPPPPRVTAILLGTTTPTVADSTVVLGVYFMPFISDPERRWFAPRPVSVRLSNGDSRASLSVRWVAQDTSALDVRDDGALRARRGGGCTKVTIEAEGLSTWVWAALDASATCR
ncbi:MAG: hypothetical protein K2X99_09800 [Gemmatimonadaceae bacterium]|nr:hypothetical protein [Gemmatimonadaceae bacterium]